MHNNEELKLQMLEYGYELLKQGGYKAVNVEQITKQVYIAKGSFYHLFASKSEFLYEMMHYKRKEAKEKMYTYLNEDHQLSNQGLHDYLMWLCQENPNVMAYLSEEETNKILTLWPITYIENEDKDTNTVDWLLQYLKNPKEKPDKELFCNFLKLAAMALQNQKYLMTGAKERTVHALIEMACTALVESEECDRVNI